MSQAQKLRKQLEERRKIEQEKADREAKESYRLTARRATELVPIMFERCIKACEEETNNARNHVRLTFDGYAAQKAAERVATKLRGEGFTISYKFDTYGFRVNSEGYTLSEGTPYVAIDIWW